MRNLPHILMLIALLGLQACGWDDDSEYEARTRASFLIVEDANTGLRSVWRHEAGVLQEGWNRDMGVPDADFSGLEYLEGELWMGDGSGNQILRIAPSNDEVLERFDGLPIQPHYFSVGERYIILGDTILNQLAFIKIRNRDVILTDFSGKPGPVLHNNRLFFLQVGDSGLHVFDEWALTPRFEHTLPYPIVETQFNQLKNFSVSMQDGTGEDYLGLVSGTDGSVAVEADPVNYQKIRFSPYLEARFGSEWLTNLRLANSQLTSGAVIFPDSMANFEVDFFESRIFYNWQNTLYSYDLNTQTRLDSFAFPDRLVGSVHWVGGE